MKGCAFALIAAAVALTGGSATADATDRSEAQSALAFAAAARAALAAHSGGDLAGHRAPEAGCRISHAGDVDAFFARIRAASTAYDEPARAAEAEAVVGIAAPENLVR